jgi:hypothetical protein
MQSPAKPQPLREFIEQVSGRLIPFDDTFSYHHAGITLHEEDLRDYIEEPVRALPPSIVRILPRVVLLFVPYLEKGDSRKREVSDCVAFELPPPDRQIWAARLDQQDRSVMAFTAQEPNLSDLHYYFFKGLADLIAGLLPEEAESRYAGLLLTELGAGTHGEVDEESWRLKQELLEAEPPLAPAKIRKLRAFQDYARQSFVDTATLYLHGICCDIDVEPGPRQLPSRALRTRLRMLEEMYPPPEGYQIFPEDRP